MGTQWINDELSEYSYNRSKCTELVEVQLDDRDYLELVKMAHERDITLNHLMNAMIHQEVQRKESEEDAKSQ